MNLIRKNTANLITFIAVLPSFFLLSEDYKQFLIPIAAFCVAFDDMDGMVARQFGIESRLGKYLDPISDAVAHSIIISAALSEYGILAMCFAAVGSMAIILRTSRWIANNCTSLGFGTTTNELVRHVYLVSIVSESFSLNGEMMLVGVTILNVLTMTLHVRVITLRSLCRKAPAPVLALNLVLILCMFWPVLAAWVLALMLVFSVSTLTTSLLFREKP